MAFSADQLLEKVNTYLATMPYVREPKGLENNTLQQERK